MQSPVEELIGLLSDKNPQVRVLAVEQVLALTAGPDGIETLKRIPVAIPKVCKLVGDVTAIAKRAVSALVNLSTDALSLDRMNKSFLVPKLMEGLADPACKHRRLSLMLMNNLTKTPAGANQLLGVGEGADTSMSPLVGMHVRKLIGWFLGMGRLGQVSAKFAAEAKPGAVRVDSVNEDGTEEDEFEYVAAVLHNVTQVEAGQKLIVDPERGVLKSLLPQLNSPSLIRRRGIAGMLYNCSFVVENEERAKFLMSSDLDLLPQDKRAVPESVVALGVANVREPDELTRRWLLEALAMMCSSRVARELMRTIGLYAVIKLCHYSIEGIDITDTSEASGEGGMVGADTGEHESKLSEADEAAVEAINKIVDFIMREEGEDGEALPVTPDEAGGAGADGATGGKVEKGADGVDGAAKDLDSVEFDDAEMADVD